MLPATVAWSFADEVVRTPPVITGGDGPAEQRVAYGTADARVHIRVLATGAAVGPPGGTLVADAAVTDPADALASGFVSTSTSAARGELLAVHDDGGGVEIARFDEASGVRVGADVPVPGSLGCTEAGAPLLTPVADDGTRLLFFTIRGSCPSGGGLVRIGMSADGELASTELAPVASVAAVPPALVVIGDVFFVVVPRTGGLDFRRADGVFDASPELTLDLGAAEVPAALAWPGTDLLLLTGVATGARVRTVALGPSPRVASTATVPGAPAGLAVSGSGSGRLAVATDAGLSVLRGDLSLVGTASGAASAPSIAGEYAYVAGRAVSLVDAAAEPLPGGPQVAPAIARGFVAFGSGALLTRDVTPPAIALGPGGTTATIADDRGVAAVVFGGGGRTGSGALAAEGSVWSSSLYRSPLELAPGPHVVRVIARDFAGNVARARAAVRVACGRSARGSRSDDVLRGGRRADCLDGLAGDDKLLVRGGGADRVACGRGRDLVRADGRDRVAGDCERVRRLRP
ncbi:MAG: hypothetical protein WKF94_05125 [Solirubrobacteraceae bacterium]